MARKKKRYRLIKVAISTKKYEQFVEFCASKHMTPNIFFRKVINANLVGFKGFTKTETDERQLKIFDFIDK